VDVLGTVYGWMVTESSGECVTWRVWFLFDGVWSASMCTAYV